MAKSVSHTTVTKLAATLEQKYAKKIWTKTWSFIILTNHPVKSTQKNTVSSNISKMLQNKGHKLPRRMNIFCMSNEKVIHAECSTMFWPNLKSVFNRSFGAKNVLLNHSLTPIPSYMLVRWATTVNLIQFLLVHRLGSTVEQSKCLQMKNIYAHTHFVYSFRIGNCTAAVVEYWHYPHCRTQQH